MTNQTNNQQHSVQMECFGGPADGRIHRVNKKWTRYLVIEDEKYIPFNNQLIYKDNFKPLNNLLEFQE
jgi:hypothetical protein